MPYRGDTKEIRIPEGTYHRYMALKGKHTHKETIEALAELTQLIGKMLNVRTTDAVTVDKALKEEMKKEGLI